MSSIDVVKLVSARKRLLYKCNLYYRYKMFTDCTPTLLLSNESAALVGSMCTDHVTQSDSFLLVSVLPECA